MKEWYYLDPDNRKDEPKTSFCACCLRPMRQTMSFESFRRIIKHPEAPWFRYAELNEKEDGLIGSECAKRVINEYGIVDLTP